jgi:hypothetical protein
MKTQMTYTGTVEKRMPNPYLAARATITTPPMAIHLILVNTRRRITSVSSSGVRSCSVAAMGLFSVLMPVAAVVSSFVAS